jgi:Tfp pilus assembly protein PilZ
MASHLESATYSIGGAGLVACIAVKAMRLLTVAFLSSEEFLSHYSERGQGRVFVKTRTVLAGGEPVLLELSFPELPNRALIRGTAEHDTSTQGRPGAWIALHPDDDSTRDFVLGVALGDVQVTGAKNRSFHRFPASLPVDCRFSKDSTGARLVTRTEDVGAGGVFVRSLTPPPVGTPVALTIGPAVDDAFTTLELSGEVAWVRNDADEKGFAVRFSDKAGADRRLLRAALRHASERGKVDFTEPS